MVKRRRSLGTRHVATEPCQVCRAKVGECCVNYKGQPCAPHARRFRVDEFGEPIAEPVQRDLFMPRTDPAS